MGLEDFLTIDQKTTEFLEEVLPFYVLPSSEITPEKIRSLNFLPPKSTGAQILKFLGAREAYLQLHQSKACLPFVFPYYTADSTPVSFDFVKVHTPLEQDRERLQTVLYDLLRGNANIDQLLAREFSPGYKVEREGFTIDVPSGLFETQDKSGNNHTLHTTLCKTFHGERKNSYVTFFIT